MDTQNMNPEKLIQTNFEDNHGVVISGGNNSISIKIGRDGVEMEHNPMPKSAEEYLDMEVRKRIDQQMEPKYILLPVKGAMEASIPLPFTNEIGFNQRYGYKIAHTTWCRWISANETNYDDKELNAFIKAFSCFDR